MRKSEFKKIMAATNIMLDVESVSLKSNAAILSIGAAAFSPNELLAGEAIQDTFYLNVDVQTCVDLGLSFDWNTIMWLLKQDKAVGEALQSNRLPLRAALYNLVEFINNGNNDYVWSKPSRFDIPILENALSVCNIDVPWDRHKVMCAHTINSLLDTDPTRKTYVPDTLGLTAHNALDDCIKQAYDLSYKLETLA